MPTLRFLFLGVVLSITIAAQDCDYAKRDDCIKSEASSKVAIPFPPLFSTPPNFVFGIDHLTNQDIQAMENQNPHIDIPTGNIPVQAVA